MKEKRKHVKRGIKKMRELLTCKERGEGGGEGGKGGYT